MTATTANSQGDSLAALKKERRRAIAFGVFFLIVAAAILMLFVLNSDSAMVSTLKLNPTTKNKPIHVPDLVLPTQLTLIVLMIITGAIGAYQLGRGFKHAATALGVVFLIFIAAFLVWATRNKAINLLGILSFTVAAATPIAFAGLSGVICERSGVINIAIEGQMLVGAMIAVLVASVTGSQWFGLGAAVVSGAVLGAVSTVMALQEFIKPKKQVELNARCPRCGADVSENWRYCPICRHDLRGDER